MAVWGVADQPQQNYETGLNAEENEIANSGCEQLGLKKKVFDWRNPTDSRYSADPRYLY